MRVGLVPAAFSAGAAIVLGGIFGEPRIAQAVASVEALVTCSTASPCVEWKNTGSGPAIQGTASASNGIHGYSGATAKAGVLGETTSTSGGYGVRGNNTSASGAGVYASGGSGFGLEATSTTNDAIYATSTSGPGGVITSTSSYGLVSASSTGLGFLTYTLGGSSSALEADNDHGNLSSMFEGDGAHLNAAAGNGAVISSGSYGTNGINAVTGHDSVRFGAIVGGTSFGLIATTGAGTGGYPLEASSANSSGTVTGFFYVDGSGGVHYTGGLYSYARTRGGTNVTAYETKATRASVEDSGTAQLVAGSASVMLDPAFGQAIDLSTPYRVFLTPNADTRGLYVAQKTATGFVVRETQGGHGSFSFDYRILAAAAGGSGARMTAVTPAVQAQAFPMIGAPGSLSTATGRAARPAIPAGPVPRS